MSRPLNVVLLGPPGAGKGTQAALMKQEFSMAHVSTGDMLRAAIAEQTPLGLAAKGYIDRGDLVPDSVVIGIVDQRLARSDAPGGFLLDGFPRTVPQAQALDDIVTLDATILIDVEPELLVHRIAGRRFCPACGYTGHLSTLAGKAACPVCGATLAQRADDQEETVRNRLAVYTRQTQPLTDYYRQKGILHTVDGTRDIDAVFGDIRILMESLL